MAEVTVLRRGMIVEVNLDSTVGSETGKTRPCVVVTNDVYNERVPIVQVVPITAWSAKKAKIITNIKLNLSKGNGLSERSIADCLQTRPIDRLHRLIKVRGEVSPEKQAEINHALKILFGLS